MKRLQTVVATAAENLDPEFVNARIACLPQILRTIVANIGGRIGY